MRARDASRLPEHSHLGAPDPARIQGMGLLATLVGAPLAWTIHFMGAYLLVAIGCTMHWRGVGIAVAVLTVLCLIAALAAGVHAFRLLRRARMNRSSTTTAALHGPRADPEPGLPESWDARLGERDARAVFLCVLACFLSVLFAYVIVLEALPLILAPACYAWTTP